MVTRQSVCLRRLADNRAQQVKFGRWLANDKVSAEALLVTAYARTAAAAAGRHVLAIQDTSELNYQAHAGRVSGLGMVGNGTDAGMFIHPLLAVDADNGACLGLAHLHQWNRKGKAAANYRRLPIEDKESYRWLKAAQAGKHCLGEAAMVTVVADRESDIYEEWARLPDARTHLLTRVCRDRALATGGMLYAWLDAQSVQGIHEFDVPARPGKRSAHRARLTVRFGRVAIKRPASCPDRGAPRHIEPLFRTLKKQGLNMEASQLETAEGLGKLSCLAVQAAVRILQLSEARDGRIDAKASEVFEAHEIEVMQRILPDLEGRTQKQKNPHPSGSLAHAAWVIARLGGWKGYASEAKPGPITMFHGLKRLEAICYGWHLLAPKMCA